MPSAHMAGKTLILVSKPLSDRDITFPVLDTERTASHKRCIWLLWLVIKRLYITLPSPLESRSSLHLSIYRNADHMSQYRTRNRKPNRRMPVEHCLRNRKVNAFFQIQSSSGSAGPGRVATSLAGLLGVDSRRDRCCRYVRRRPRGFLGHKWQYLWGWTRGICGLCTSAYEPGGLPGSSGRATATRVLSGSSALSGAGMRWSTWTWHVSCAIRIM